MTTETAPPRRDSVRLKNARKHAPSSQRWLARQLNDPYVTAAKAQGWRSRAAFKLLELDDKYGLIKKHARVVDLGAAPGGWSQVALARGAASVAGIDLLPIIPVAGASFIEGDFLEDGMEARLTALLGGPADLVLSDMAPNTTGHTATDHIRIMALAELALGFATEILLPGGAFVTKLFQGGAERGMLERLKTSFATVRHAKPPASRKDSKEMYVVATGFRK
jgi:23S rRNA (uridine2552-2'-O)-methyltransferase